MRDGYGYMPFRARLTIALVLTLAVCAAMGQDPYAPGQYRQAPQQPLPPGSQYPLPQPGVNQPGVPNQAWRYPLPQNAPATPPPVQPAPARPASPQIVQPATSEVAALEPPSPDAVLFKPGQIVARIGDKSILYADVAPTVNIILALAQEKLKTDAERKMLEAQREALTKNVVNQALQNKMFFIEFERGMPNEIKTDAKKRSEMEAKQRKIVRNAFESSLASAREKVATATQDEIDGYMRQEGIIVRLAVLMNNKKLESPGELDRELRQYGTTLEQQVREFGEYIMGMEALRTAMQGNSHAKGKGSKGIEKKEVTHEDMLDYYKKHQAEYYIPAKARFEMLTARFSRFNGDKNAAKEHIIAMGNAVILGGTPFPAVARKQSHDPHSDEGGLYDWVTPGGLASKPIDQAIFTIEVDKLSQIIEDDQGYHIVHVLERKPAGQVAFEEAQENIRKSIDSARKTAEQQKFFAELKARTKVWTIYDQPSDTGVQPAGVTKR